MDFQTVINDLYDLDGESVSEVLGQIGAHGEKPELKAKNPEGWEIAMICFASCQHIDCESYFGVDSDSVSDYFWSLPWENCRYRQ